MLIADLMGCQLRHGINVVQYLLLDLRLKILMICEIVSFLFALLDYLQVFDELFMALDASLFTGKLKL